MSSDGTIPPRAVEWIYTVLHEGNNPEPTFHLGRLLLPQLKKIANELKSRTINIHLMAWNSTVIQSPITIYVPPKSGSKKAEWVSSLSTYFNLHGASNNNLYDLLNGKATVAAAAVGSSSTAPAPARSPPSAASKISTTNTNIYGTPMAHTARVSLANVSTNKPSAIGAAGRMSPAKNSPKQTIHKSPHTHKATVGQHHHHHHHHHGLTTALHTTATTATAQDRSRYNPFLPNGILPQSNLPTWSNITHSLPATTNTTASVPHQAVGMKRTATTSPVRSSGPVQPLSNVQRQLISESSTHQSNEISTNVNTAALPTTTEDDAVKPRDLRESTMLANLRQMGFTKNLEILTALRAVAAQRVENCSNSAVGTAEWSVQEQVEAAMTWIVMQREEAAFARELDRARILSEQDNAAQEQARKQRMAQEVEHASVVDLLGSANARSKHFPHSVLLKNQSVVTSILNPVVSGSSLGKKQVIRLLNLELKARKWYGTVLPYSYFEYVLCPSFGSLAGKDVNDVSQIVDQVTDALEKAMYNLSEQVEGGVGSVPKLFYDAQTKASREGKPTSSPEDSEVVNDDDDIVVLEQPRLPLSSTCAGSPETQRPEVINIA